MLYFWLIPIIPLTAGLIYAGFVKDILEEKGLLKLGLQRSEIAKVNIVRGFLLLGIVIFLIFATGKSQLIIGFIGIVLGFLIMFFSEPIHRILATGGGSNSSFRGDDKIKLVGIVICILSAGWMSGITQGLLYGFLKTANLIPSSDVIDYY
jgi:hypothetical protein